MQEVERPKCVMASREWLATWTTREMHYQPILCAFHISLPTLYKPTLPTKL